MKNLLKPLASLRLTVVLLVLTIILVFAGTFAQIDQGIWQVQSRYFHSFFCIIHFQLFAKRPPLGEPGIPGGFPMLGGYSLIILLLINLLAAHTVRFKFNRKRLGIIAIHAGLILLLVGEIVTSTQAREGRMIIDVGQTVNFTQDVRKAELAIIDPSDPNFDQVVVIPAWGLETAAKDHSIIANPKQPFQIQVDAYYENSAPLGPMQLQQAKSSGDKMPVATVGQGLRFGAIPVPNAKGITAEDIDMPSAYVTPIVNGQSQATYFLSTMEINSDDPKIKPIHLDDPQPIEVAGKTYLLNLRWKRDYKAYSITLKDFSHDRFVGTQIDSNFSSIVRLVDPSQGEDRDVHIWMNHPLRCAGETFYQAGFLKGDKTTILQVVHNPGWLIPYISCVLVGTGMIIHFGMVLLEFLRKQKIRLANVQRVVLPLDDIQPGQRYLLKPSTGGLVWPTVAVALGLLYFAGAGMPPKFSGPFDLGAFGHLPINFNGRVMPLDSVARNSLRILSGKDSYKVDGERKSQPAIRWLADVFADHDAARVAKVIRLDNPDVIGALALDHDRNTFSFDEILAKQDLLVAQLKTVEQVPKENWNPYQKAVAELDQHLALIDQLSSIESLFFIPPEDVSGKWTTMADAMKQSQAGTMRADGTSAGALNNIATALSSYHQKNAKEFGRAVRNQLEDFGGNSPETSRKVNVEAMFNQFDPFVNSMAMYVIAAVIVALSWLITPASVTLRKTAFAVLLLTFLVHSVGLIARIYIQGRPPVTNLYSSAIFIGWAATGFCLVLERIFRNGIGSLAAAAIAFPSLLIAHYLAANDGDTMKQLQAVLDTNIWLATHVVVITLGYTATFLAGIIAIVYVIGRLAGAFGADESGKSISRMIYGTICFAMLFSFVGTVLGGIWADQSWGRFWGWDPKENGAVLIVLWNAVILHARWGGLVKERGVANLTIFGNVVTAWSWFGTNMLGVGLHSYGFMQSALFWLIAFILSQLVMIAIGLIPVRKPNPERFAVELKAREPQYV